MAEVNFRPGGFEDYDDEDEFDDDGFYLSGEGTPVPMKNPTFEDVKVICAFMNPKCRWHPPIQSSVGVRTHIISSALRI